MADEIAIYGAGGFGREIALLLAEINEVKKTWQIVGFYDDGKKKGEVVDDLEVLGGLQELNSAKRPLSLVVAIADPQVRKKIVSSIANRQLSYPVIIHPNALTGDKRRNRFGRGTIITAGNILTTNIILNEFVIVNLSNTIGHDVQVGNFSTIMPGCHISGNVSIGEASLIGTGAGILQNIRLGSNSKVGAGAVVIGDVEEGETVLGVPAKARSNVSGV